MKTASVNKNAISNCIALFFKLPQIVLLFALITSCSTLKDKRDNHVYKTIKIGTQKWMAENLAFKTDSGCWVYDNKTENLATYGYLYNYPAAQSACPAGWHLPTDAEWKTLEQYLGLPENELNKTGFRGTEQEIDLTLKAQSTLWGDTEMSSNKLSGFNALPAGFRYFDGSKYMHLGKTAIFWIQALGDKDKLNPQTRSLSNSKPGIDRHKSNQHYGFSVRCVKD